MSAPACSQTRGAIGSAARPAPGREVRGVVERVFARSAHLRAGDAFVTLGEPGLPRHPFSILIPRFPDGLTAGGGFSLRERGLWLQAGFALDLSGLRRYQPAQKVARLAGPAALARTLAAARETTWGPAGRAGQSSIFYPAPDGAAARPARGSSPPPGPEDLLRGRALALGRRLGAAAAGRDWDGLAVLARELAGLGLGLTPSGDDFLAGMLAALRFCGLSGGARAPQAVLDRAAAGAAARTSAFSGFLLRGAARGLVAEPVSRWLCFACAGKTRLAVPASRRVLEMGSTSGADTLAGLIAGVAAATGVACA
jgi:hypothetical protein